MKATLFVLGFCLVLGLILRWLINYSLRWNSGNGMPQAFSSGFSPFGPGRDTTVYAYGRSTLEHHQENEERLEELRATEPKQETAIEQHTVIVTEVRG